MQHALLIQLDKHPRERDLIGKLILAYGELEFMLLDMLRAVLGDDLMTATRTLYRLRSEANRLSVADAIIRPKMGEQGLLQEYLDAHCTTFACKNIRNRYAHGQYISDKGHLWVGDLDEAAKSTGAQAQVKFKSLPLTHLQREFDYFAYAEHALIYATNQFRLKTGQSLPENAVIPRPQKRHAPKLGNPPAGRSPPNRRKG
jgi:hypothetical protein